MSKNNDDNNNNNKTCHHNGKPGAIAFFARNKICSPTDREADR